MKQIKSLLLRAWNSPTLTTWGSLGVRTLSLVFVLPLVLNRFPGPEFTIWCLFSTIISLQLLAELGFGVSFARVTAYAMAGVARLAPNEGKTVHEHRGNPNYELLHRILSTIRAIFGRLSWVLGLGLAVFGTWALLLPVSRTEDPKAAWTAWGVVAICTVVGFRSNGYSCFLQGTNHVALLRRWETVFALGSILTSTAVLTLDGGLLWLSIGHQTWTVLGAWRNRLLIRHICDGRFSNLPRGVLDMEVFKVVWPSAWRSAIGTFMSTGLIHLSGIFVAQTKDVGAANSYLLGLRMIQAISQFAMAPFYSHLPKMATLYASQQLKELIAVAVRGMRLAHWTFILPSLIVGFFGPGLLTLIGSKTRFPELSIWFLLAAGHLMERYGAMHIQMYSLTNRVIWHVANGVTGCLMILIWILFVPKYGLIAVAAGSLLAYLSFYVWFSSLINHRHFNLPFPKFDLGCLLPFSSINRATLGVRNSR